MIPILYEKTTRTFTNDYLARLVDTISCTVTEGRNDVYELEMQYPCNGVYANRIELDSIIKAKPNNTDEPQPFRVYKITAQKNSVFLINARHIVYDLAKVTVAPFTSTGTISDAIDGLLENANPTCGFNFTTNKTTAGTYKVATPKTFRSLMGGTSGSLLDVFGTAEYHYDEYDIELLTQRGTNSGVVIEYGVNLIELQQEEACNEVYTAVFPFWTGIGNYVQLTENIVSVEGSFPFSRIMALDLSNDFQSMPTEEQLRQKARAYIQEQNIGVPKVSLDVTFADLGQDEVVNLCDTVQVNFEKYGVTASAKCIELSFDVLRERPIEIKLGSYRNTFVDTVTDQVRGITDIASLDANLIENEIKKITTNTNGYLLLHSSTNTAHIDEILIVTGTDQTQAAEKIWRWNRNGLGFSATGYNGTYSTAITAAGDIVASMIKTGTMQAIEIINGNGTFHVYPNGYLSATSGYIGSVLTGFHIVENEIYNSKIKLFSLGVAIRQTTTKDSGFIGKISYIRTDSAEYYNPTGQTVENPGIGMIADKDAGCIGMYYYDSSASTNKTILNYPVVASSGDGTSNAQVGAVNMYKNIDMHRNKLRGSYLPQDNTISFWLYEYEKPYEPPYPLGYESRIRQFYRGAYFNSNRQFIITRGDGQKDFNNMLARE